MGLKSRTFKKLNKGLEDATSHHRGEKDLVTRVVETKDGTTKEGALRENARLRAALEITTDALAAHEDFDALVRLARHLAKDPAVTW